MKKFGYTLAEVIITLCIIGAVSALMIPAINRAKPDSTKESYLKAYDSLSKVVDKAVNDSAIYSPVYEVNDNIQYDVRNFPLLNFGQPMDTSLSSVPEDEYKLANIIKESFNGSGTCTTGAQTCTFTTPENMTWEITPQPKANSLMQASASATSVRFYDKVKVTIDGNDFTFFVEANGDITPVDVQGQAYIKYRKKVAGKDNTDGLTEKTPADIQTIYTIGTDINRL